MPTLHAFLVASNQYAGIQSSLTYAESDLRKMQTYLQSHLAAGWRLSLGSLVGPQATKTAVLGGMEHHFAGARGEDVCLFYFAGHGSKLQCPPPELLAAEQREGTFETILAYDSRSAAGDIIDKELSHIIGKTTARAGFRGQGHVAVILDSCYSGDGSRDGDEEDLIYRTVPHLYEMPINYFYGYQQGYAYPMVGHHVQLAAAGSEERAVDGVFTQALVQSLERGGGQQSYHTLTQGIRSRIRVQHPGLHTSGGMGGLMFLGGAIR